MDIKGVQGINASINTFKNEAGKDKDDIKQENKEVLGSDQFIKSEDKEPLTYGPGKTKLTTEEIKAIKEDQENQKANLIKKFISDTIKNQNKLLGKAETQSEAMPKGTSDLLVKIFGSVENAYPPLATTQEGAQAAISEGGAYSVEAVADRIMTMAKYFAGDDPEKLQQMREAVEKGFKEAGMDFKSATNSDLPQICQDTIAEVMKRFDALQGKE